MKKNLELGSKYIGDELHPKIRTWNSGDIILITAPTGSGKNFFVNNHLHSYCRDFNKKILLLSNRKPLKNQNDKDKIKENLQNITTMNYQELEIRIKKHAELPSGYDFIVIDECHYFFNDTGINRNTDLSLEWLFRQTKAIRLIMSATPDLMRYYMDEKNILYFEHSKKSDYSFVDKFLFYNSDNVIKKLLFELPEDEKAIYFASTLKSFEISEKFETATFVCSDNNKQYKNKSDKETLRYITKDQKFDYQILCTTTVLDNGINIKDPAVKHIIVDNINLDTIVQCIGRKRLNKENDEKINVYIKNKSKKAINWAQTHAIKEQKQANDFLNDGDIAFTKKYHKENTTNIIDTIVGSDDEIHHKINETMYIKNQKDIERYEQLLESKNGFINDVFNKFKCKYSILDDELDGITLQEQMIKYINIKMFKEEQKEFKQFLLKELFDAPKENHNSLGINTINGYFIDKDLPYIITSKKERSKKSDNVNKYYWIITEK
ncbi:MAG: DEAD/DEAH box helicase family protein [Bacilli bacterium]